MRKYIFILLFSSVLLSPVQAETNKTNQNIAGLPVKIDISRGLHWQHTMRIARFIPIKVLPQIAVWAETPEGDFIATLYVTRRAATQDWRGGNVRRPGALPCWSHRRGVRYSDGLYMPTKDNPLSDAETGATPEEGFTLESHLDVPREAVVFFVEVNNSFDPNSSFPQKEGDVNGQPSAVYRAVLDCGKLPASAEFTLAGYGSPDGSDGDIHPDTNKLTTGKQIVGRMTVTVGQ